MEFCNIFRFHLSTSANKLSCINCTVYIDATGHSGGSFGQGSGPIFLDDVACSGSETQLIDCSHDRTTSDCSHSRDAGVTCETQCMSAVVG